MDYGRNGTLYGTFLTRKSVVTGSTTDPAKAASWRWNGNPAQLTSGTRTPVDQPWLVVNRDPATARQDDVYVGYDDFSVGARMPDMRVAVSFGANPVNITVDNKAGTANPSSTNPGLRLAADPRNGTMYALYERSFGSKQPKNVTYKLNRSTDGGASWTLNGNANGLTVDRVTSDQAPGFKFGGVNALLGGVDHLAVDPRNGDVYVVYGQDVSGGNQLKIRRLTPNGSGGLHVGTASDVSSSTDAALPSVAVASNGTIGVLYDTFNGMTKDGFPIFSAHLAQSTDHGATFSDVVLQTFQSPVKGDSDTRQRVLGDFQQLKAVGQTFYGTFPGNTSGVPATRPPIDAMFFSVQAATRTVTFVHGINGNFLDFDCLNLTGGFKAILAQVCADPAFTEESFPYYQDVGYASPGATPPCPEMPRPDTNTGPLFVDPDAIDPNICDSKGALAFTAAALHDHLAALNTPDTVLANSLGAAITRGWLAIAQFNGSGDQSLAHADSVVFLQGAQAGSWAALAGQAIASAPVIGPIAQRISQLIKLDVNRPGVIDVTPQSPWYFSVNPFGVPPNVAYYNFYSNLLVNFQVNLLFFTLNMGSVNTGDLVMLPGSDDPTDLPLLGGAKFLPGGQQTANRHEYAVNGQVNVNPADLEIPVLLARDVLRLINSPINHFNFGSNVGTIEVPSCAASAPITTVAGEVFRLLQNPTAGCASAEHRQRRTVITSASSAPTAAHSGSSGPTRLQAPFVARARSGDPVLTVQLQAGVRNTGQFNFTVAKTGTWIGVIGVRPAGRSAIVHLRGKVNAEFTANGSNRPVSATVRMEGTINTAHHTATISIRATSPGKPRSVHYLINNNPRPKLRKAAPAARVAGATIQARDFARLYKMAASDITSRFTLAQFVALLTGQHRPRITNVAPSGAGTFSMNAGLTFFAQKFTFTTIRNGKVIHHTSDIVMVWENKAWRFSGTTAPTA